MALTLLEVVGLAHVHAHERHELQLRQALAGGRGQREQVPQVPDLRVDQVAAQLARALRRLARIEAAVHQSKPNVNKFYLRLVIF